MKTGYIHGLNWRDFGGGWHLKDEVFVSLLLQIVGFLQNYSCHESHNAANFF